MKIPMSDLPGMSQLVQDYLQNYDRVARYFAGNALHFETYLELATTVKSRELPLARMVPVLKQQNQRFGCGQQTLEHIDLLLERRACAVVTGQQTGLFGGPLFTLYKALTAVKLAERLSRTCEGCFVPVFWLASDDHDFREVNHVHVLDKQNQVSRLTYTGHPEDSRIPVSHIALSANIDATIAQLDDITHPSDFKDDILHALADAYQPGTTFSEAFAKWLTTLFKSFGLIVIDASPQEVKKLGADIFAQEIEAGSPSTEAALLTSADLQKDGYHTQVQLHDGVLNLFLTGKERQSIQFDTGRYVVKNSGDAYTPEELLKALASEPQRFSPNVLLRPLYQDALFPTVAYVAGPSEIAYYAQMKGLYARFELPMPIIYPRKSVTLLEARVEKILDKYGLNVPAFWGDNEQLIREIVRAHLPQSLEQELSTTRESIAQRLQALQETVTEFDPTLQGAVDNTIGRLLNQVDGLEKKVMQAYKKRNDVITQHIHKAGNSLYPHHHLQERELNIVPFLFKYGWSLIDTLYEAMDISNTDHQIIRI